MIFLQLCFWQKNDQNLSYVSQKNDRFSTKGKENPSALKKCFMALNTIQKFHLGIHFQVYLQHKSSKCYMELPNNYY